MIQSRNADKSIFTYNDQGIAFDRKGFWSFDNGMARNIVIFGVDNSSSPHTDNPKKKILLSGEGPTKGINGSVANFA